MEDVGQALRHDSVGGQDFDSHNNLVKQGALMEQFAASQAFDGSSHDELLDFDEQNLDNNIEGFLQRFERAEYSLGHTLDDPQAIDKAFLSDSENVVSIFDHHNFHYSIKETSHEQDSSTLTGSQLDENQVTDIGRLKIGIQDSAHEVRNRKKTEDAARFVRMMSAQEQYVAELEARMEQLSKEIEELNEEIKLLNDAQAALEEGDINENSSAGASRRKTVAAALSRSGMDMDDFRGPNGRISNDSLKQTLEEIEEQKQTTLQDREASFKDTAQKLDLANQGVSREEIENKDTAAVTDLTDDELNGILNPTTDSNEIADNNDWESDWGGDGWSNDWEADAQNDEQYALDDSYNDFQNDINDGISEDTASYDNVVPLQTEEASRVYGSVAADDTERNVISSAFAKAASGEQQPTPDVAQTQDYTQEQKFVQSPGGMAV